LLQAVPYPAKYEKRGLTPIDLTPIDSIDSIDFVLIYFASRGIV